MTPKPTPATLADLDAIKLWRKRCNMHGGTWTPDVVAAELMKGIRYVDTLLTMMETGRDAVVEGATDYEKLYELTRQVSSENYARLSAMEVALETAIREQITHKHAYCVGVLENIRRSLKSGAALSPARDSTARMVSDLSEQTYGELVAYLTNPSHALRQLQAKLAAMSSAAVVTRDELERAAFMFGQLEIRMQVRVDSGKESVAIGQTFAREIVATARAGLKLIAQLTSDAGGTG